MTARLRTTVDVAQAIESDSRFASWQVVSQAEHCVEVSHNGFVVVLVWSSVWSAPSLWEPYLSRAQAEQCGLLLLGTDDELVAHQVEYPRASVDFMPVPVSPHRLLLALRARQEVVALQRDAAAMTLEFERAQHANELLISIGRALSQQRDIHSLLALILRRSREVTGADAGSVYIVEGDDEDLSKRTLHFTESQNDSVSVESKGFTMPVSSSSIVGTCVLSGEVIRVDDLYRLDAPGTGNNPWGFVHDRTWDDKHGYQTRSMLALPMISARDQVIGVVQLINKRADDQGALRSPEDFETRVTRFNDASTNFAATLASQAGIALENALLYDEVRQLFEGFVRASVTAIESRDPTTSGHSERVADLTVALAKVADRAEVGAYAAMQFTRDDLKQIEYAGLLHDFGKVGVREHVLVKAKKLYEHQRDLVMQRFAFIRQTLQTEALKSKVSYLMESSREQALSRFAELDRQSQVKLAELDEFLQFVLQANEPSVMDKGGFERVAEIARRTYVDLEGETQPYLSQQEVGALQILRGSLTDSERSEIESHVVHTYNFLNQIPWGRTFRNVPEIAGAHHEKINGSGYPNQLVGSDIPVPAKMMTISDIFDALTASDRPYKKAMPVTRALDILGFEVKAGNIDRELHDMFVDAKVYELVVKG